MKKRQGLAAFLLLLAVWLSGCALEANPGSGADAVKDEGQAKLAVKMLNVGQGDAILIRTAEQTVLIDTSDVDEREKLRRELQKAGVTALDKVILTHPHADHIGGMDTVLKEFSVKDVYDNGMPSTSPVWRSYMKLMAKDGIPRHALKAGDALDFGGGVRFQVYAPSADLVAQGQQKGYKHDPNNESIVGRLEYGSFSMLFTGDAEKAEEQQVLKDYGDAIRSDVLKAPHHGSKTSSSPKFLNAVRPQAALISLGAGNEYGHPHQVTLDKYEKLGCKVYRTDKNGTITVVSDGKGYEVEEETP